VAGDHHLIAMPTAGGTPIDLSKSTGLELWGSGASLSPDGDTVLVGYNDTTDVGLVLINASSGAIIRKISALAMGVFPAGSDSPPQYTPDGQFIIIAGHKITGAGIENNPDIFMMNTDGTGVRNLTSTPNNAELKALVR
jgi:Tol biopolymer transport system component